MERIRDPLHTCRASRTWHLPRSVKQFLVSDFLCDFQVPAHVGVEECRSGRCSSSGQSSVSRLRCAEALAV